MSPHLAHRKRRHKVHDCGTRAPEHVLAVRLVQVAADLGQHLIRRHAAAASQPRLLAHATADLLSHGSPIHFMCTAVVAVAVTLALAVVVVVAETILCCQSQSICDVQYLLSQLVEATAVMIVVVRPGIPFGMGRLEKA